MQGQASIPMAVFVATLVAGSDISQEERTRVQQSLACIGAVAEGSGSDERYRHALVPLFEWTIVGSGCAHIFRQRPLALMRYGAGMRRTARYLRPRRASFEGSVSH